MSYPSSPQHSENALALEDNTLMLDSVKQGDTAALQKFLDLKLVHHKVRVVEIELRQARLQLSLSGAVVPEQNVVEPLLQRWIAPLALANISTIELYGQRDGSDLPFWRSSFSPSDFDPNHLGSIMEPEVTLPTEFIDPLQIEFKASSVSTLTEDPLPKRSMEAQSTPVPAGASEIDAAIASDSDDFGAIAEREMDSPVIQESPVPAVISEEKMKAVKTFLARYAAGEREFAKINLNETDLSGVNLTLANLHASELIWTNLEGANLYHINLSSAKLRHANLSGAMLRSSNLQGTDFLNANLRGADLSWSNLNGANLTGADLTDANLKNAILERVILPDGTLLD